MLRGQTKSGNKKLNSGSAYGYELDYEHVLHLIKAFSICFSV